MFYAGIDPGKDGGAVVLSESGAVVTKRKTPLLRGTGRARDEYDLPGMGALLLSLKDLGAHVFLEKSQPMPASMGGGVANFQRGYSLGLWSGMLSVLGIRHTLVSPQSWQREMFRDLPKADTKQLAVVVAGRLWPKVDWRVEDGAESSKKVKPDLGLIDAALIAEYGRRNLR